MNTEISKLRNKEIEQVIVNLSVKVANAMQLLHKSKEMTVGLENALIDAQRELEELYVGLDTPDGNGE